MPFAISSFLLAKKSNRLAATMVISCVIGYAWHEKIEWRGYTVYSLYYDIYTSKWPFDVSSCDINEIDSSQQFQKVLIGVLTCDLLIFPHIGHGHVDEKSNHGNIERFQRWHR